MQKEHREEKHMSLYSEMEAVLKHFECASTAGDHSMACDAARSVLERKSPEAMTPQERRLAMELCYEIGDYALMETLRKLDNH